MAIMPTPNVSDVQAQVDEVLSLQYIRTQANKVLGAARQGKLTHFEFDESRMLEVADYVMNIISRDFGPNRYNHIPPHGRWQHFTIGNKDRISPLIEQWTQQGCSKTEVTRRIVDLLFVSVLLDAGAGDVWNFKEPDTGLCFGRSEGIALASFHMFVTGKFHDGKDAAPLVNARGLIQLDETTMKKGFQISTDNSMAGFSSRVALLQGLGTSLRNLPEIFGPMGRPGNLVDYLLGKSKSPTVLDFSFLFNTLQKLLLPVWPKSRTQIEGRPVGDAWPLSVLTQKAARSGQETITGGIQPFHKLTQWLCYSLTVPFARILELSWINQDIGTGLAEYRNGGIFVDIEVLKLKPDALEQGRRQSGRDLPQFDATSDVIVEWRAMTVTLLDELHMELAARLRKDGISLSLCQMLEAGTFKAGRELAAKYRPASRSSPILISGDGTLF